MVVGVLEVILRIPGATSLKAKRMVIKSLKDRIRNKFNVSAAEVSQLSNARGCTLGISHVSNDKQYSNQVLSKLVDFIETSRDVELDDYHLVFL